jgi:ribosomal protein L44E
MTSINILLTPLQIQRSHNKGIGLLSHDEARAHKRGKRIGKKPKKKKPNRTNKQTKKNQDSIRCLQCKGTNAGILKRQRPIGEGDQELQKRLV